jgi:hypothetical protein
MSKLLALRDAVNTRAVGEKVSKAMVKEFTGAIAAHRHFGRPVNGIAA